MPATPVDIDPLTPWFSQIIAFADRTTADDGRTRRVQQLLVLLTLLVAALLIGVGCVLLGLGGGTGVAGSVATLLLGGGSAVGVQRIVRRRAARRAHFVADGPRDAATPADSATDSVPAPRAGPTRT